jgi:hypothetical protein
MKINKGMAKRMMLVIFSMMDGGSICKNLGPFIR